MARRVEETGAGNLTVEEMCLGATMLLTEVAKQAEARTKSTLSSGVTLSGSALSEAMLLYWHSQAMAELSAALFWLERNDYARSLTMKQILGSYGHISMALTKLIDLIGLAMDYAEMLGFDMEPGPKKGYGQEEPPL